GSAEPENAPLPPIFELDIFSDSDSEESSIPNNLSPQLAKRSKLSNSLLSGRSGASPSLVFPVSALPSPVFPGRSKQSASPSIWGSELGELHDLRSNGSVQVSNTSWTASSKVYERFAFLRRLGVGKF
ncbi:unnamed protein product, partial [Polarella glacialis]